MLTIEQIQKRLKAANCSYIARKTGISTQSVVAFRRGERLTERLQELLSKFFKDLEKK